MSLPGRATSDPQPRPLRDPRTGREQAFEYIAPALARHGYELTVLGGSTLLVLPPLAAAVDDPGGRVHVSDRARRADVPQRGRGDRRDRRRPAWGHALRAHGVGPLNVRRAFANLRD
jgi:hypothetical protein